MPGHFNMPIIRIAGLMRSGTNLVTWMLRKNFESVRTATMLLGWKHGPIYREKPELSIDDFLDPRYRANLWNFSRAHPEVWSKVTESRLYKGAAEQQLNGTFAVALAVRDPRLWYTSCLRVHTQDPNFLIHGIKPREAAKAWNEQHADWLSSMGSRSVIVDTEALRKEPESVLQKIAVALELRRKEPLRTPKGYLSLTAHEELFELMGLPTNNSPSDRKLTKIESVDQKLTEEFVRLLDDKILERLKLRA